MKRYFNVYQEFVAGRNMHSVWPNPFTKHIYRRKDELIIVNKWLEMDKRWRNLILIVVTIIILVVIGFSGLLYTNEQKLNAVLKNNNYSTEDFSIYLSTYSEALSPSLINDLKEFSKSLDGDDKKFIEKVIELQDDKNGLLVEFSEFLYLDPVISCDDFYSYDDLITEKLYAVDYVNSEINKINSNLKPDINDDKLEEQFLAAEEILNQMELNCLEPLTFNYGDEI